MEDVSSVESAAWNTLDDGSSDDVHLLHGSGVRDSSAGGHRYLAKIMSWLQAFWMGWKFYSRFSKKEMKRRLFNFIIGSVSCTITVQYDPLLILFLALI